MTFSIVSTFNQNHITNINIVFNEISIIFTNRSNEVLFVSKRTQPHTKLSEIKWMIIYETDGHLKYLNKSRVLFNNRILRDDLFEKAGIEIHKPNAHLPAQQPPIISDTPTRRRQPVKKQIKYRPITTPRTKWSKEDLEIFMQKRFPE